MNIKSIFLILCLSLISINLFSQEELNDWELYTQALEAVIQEKDQEAIILLEELLRDFPDSPLVPKAQIYLDQLKNKIDHSGIVSYYASQLISSVYVFMTIPSLFDISDTLTMGLLGLGGVSLGIWSAWETSIDTNISLAHELWVEGNLFLLLANYNLFILGIESYNHFIGTKTYSAIQLGLITTQRILSYFWIKNTPNPSYGKPAYLLWYYSWGQFYTWLTYVALNNVQIPIDIYIWISMCVSNTATVAAYLIWDQYPMSLERSGIISLFGIGGGGIGFFGSMIISYFAPMNNVSLPAIITMLSSAAGKVVGYFLTQEMPDEKINSNVSGREKLSFSVSPIVIDKNFGFQCKLAY